MRKLRVWGMAGVLAIGLAAQTAAAGEEEPKPAAPRSFWDRMFMRKQKQTAVEIMEEETAKKSKAVQEAEEAEKAREARKQAAALRAREEYMRREKVIDKLMQLALASNDKELLKKVEHLGDRAMTVYRRKSGQPAGPAVARKKDGAEKGKGTSEASERGVEP